MEYRPFHTKKKLVVLNLFHTFVSVSCCWIACVDTHGVVCPGKLSMRSQSNEYPSHRHGTKKLARKNDKANAKVLDVGNANDTLRKGQPTSVRGLALQA